MNRVLGITLAVLALAIGIVPQFTHCASHPDSTMNGMPSMQTPMTKEMDTTMADTTKSPKCQGSAQAEIGVAIPLFGVGAVLTLSRRRNLILGLSAGGAILGILAIGLPAALTGTCGMATMICNTAMKPLLYILGSVTVVGSIVGMIVSSRVKN